MKNISDAKSKNILKIEDDEKEIECIEETFEALFNVVVDSSLFALLFSNVLLTLMSDFVVNEIVAICQDTSSSSWVTLICFRR